MCRGSNSVIALLHVGMLICLLPVTQADVTTIFKRREATPQLPLDDTRLRRNDDAGAHAPEQVISFFFEICGHLCCIGGEGRWSCLL